MGDNLLSLIKDLQRRMEKLEKDNCELKKWAYREKQKIDIIAWLNEHHLPMQDFSQWCASLQVGEKELELVFENRIERGFYYIIERNLPIEERRNFPLKAFSHQRKSVFYVYDKGSWRKIKKGEFEHIVTRINKELFVQFSAWEEEHPEMLEEGNREQWAKKLQRILLLPEKKWVL